MCAGHYFIDCQWCWIAFWYLETWLTRPPDLGFAVSLAVPPLQMLTVPLLISLLRISSSSSSGLYCDDMPCALYHMLFAVVKGGKTLSGDVQIRSRKSVLLILSIHSEKINVCCLQHIALIQRIQCLKHWLRLINVNVRAGQSQEEGQGSFVDNSDEGSFGFQGQRLPSLCRYEE